MLSKPLYLTVGQTPGLVAGTNTYSNANLAGSYYVLFLVGTGPLYPDTDEDVENPDYHVLDEGGFAILDGRLFSEGERILVISVSSATSPAAQTSNYSNGFDIIPVLSSLSKRLGWRQPTESGSPVLNIDNKTSVSGRYFNGGFHSLVTIKNLCDTAEDKDITDDQFNTLIYNLQQDAIMRCLNGVFREPELIEQKLMYTRFGTNDTAISNSGQFVGYIINVANDFSISTQINSATLYFDTDCNFNLYLFMDGIKEAIQVIPVSCTAYARTVIEFDSLVLNFKTGRKYYFGYFQSEIGSAKAVREQIETWATTRCFEAFTFTAPAIDSNTDFNHDYRQYGSLPQGINLEIISFRDHTQKILRKSNLFDEAQGLQVAIMALEQITNSTRSNQTERVTKEMAEKVYQEVKQAFPTKEFPVVAGLESRFMSEMKRLRDTFFPPQEAMSISMEPDALGIESSWFKQNYRQITNPPIQVQ